MATTAKKSTAVAVRKSTNIVSIQEQLKAQAAEMADRTTPASGNAIRVSQDKKFVLPDGSKTDGPLELVVVEFTSKNSFYEGSFDPKNITPPACFAIGSNPKTLAPSKNAPLAQATDCASCPNNQFGSNGAGKACKNSRVLAVLPPDADASTPIWTITTSPTANKNFDAFVNNVARMFQTPPVGVVVKVGFDPAETYAKLTFTDPAPNENLEVHYARMDEARAIVSVEPDTSSFVKAPPTRKAGARR